MGFLERKGSADPRKFQMYLSMMLTRIRMQQSKSHNMVKTQQRAIVELLEGKKYDSARIKVESLMREEFTIEGLEILALFTELLSSRFQALGLPTTQNELKFFTSKSKKTTASCPSELKEAVSSLLWGGVRCNNIPELITIRKILEGHFGTAFVTNAESNAECAVNERLIEKLSILALTNEKCVSYLENLANEYGVELDSNFLRSENAIIPMLGNMNFASTTTVSPDDRKTNQYICEPKCENLKDFSYIEKKNNSGYQYSSENSSEFMISTLANGFYTKNGLFVPPIDEPRDILEKRLLLIINQ